MKQDALNRRSMGLTYDEDILLNQIANGDRGDRSYDDGDGGYDELFGSDLYIASPTRQLEGLAARIDKIELSVVPGSLSIGYLDDLRNHAVSIQQNLELQLNAMKVQDRVFATAIQDWVLKELSRRQADRGSEYEHTSEESYLETIDVIEHLATELEQDNEDPALISLAQTWRLETIAELSSERVKKLYVLAA
jgi:hypothetical protein